MASGDGASACRDRETRILCVMRATAAVPLFEGNPDDLEYFVRRMDAVVDQIADSALDIPAMHYITPYFLSRIDRAVLHEVNASLDTPWVDLKAALRRKYGGTGKSTARILNKELLVDKAREESCVVFAKKLFQAFQKAKTRTEASYTDEKVAQARVDLIEELAIDRLLTNLPRTIKRWVLLSNPGTLRDAVEAIEREEEEYREEKERDARMRNRGDSRPKILVKEVIVPSRTRDKPRRELRDSHRREGAPRPYQEPRDSRYRGAQSMECWACGDLGHRKRDCPRIYRRDDTRRGVVSSRYRPEPMEVNAGRLGTSLDGSSSESDRESRCSEASERVASVRGPPSKVKGKARRKTYAEAASPTSQ